MPLAKRRTLPMFKDRLGDFLLDRWSFHSRVETQITVGVKTTRVVSSPTCWCWHRFLRDKIEVRARKISRHLRRSRSRYRMWGFPCNIVPRKSLSVLFCYKMRSGLGGFLCVVYYIIRIAKSIIWRWFLGTLSSKLLKRKWCILQARSSLLFTLTRTSNPVPCYCTHT